MKTVSALDLRQSLGKVIAALEKDGEPVILEKNGKPVAALISLKDYRERFAEKAAYEERLRLIEEMDKLVFTPPPGSPTGLEILRRLRGYED